MQAAHVSAVALVGAGIIAAIPIAPYPDISVAEPAVRLAAASIANIPINLVEAIASAPANEVKALQALADSLNYGGSWWVLDPLNVVGYDPADPPKGAALTAAFVPFPALSGPLGDQVNTFFKAQFRMNAGCVAIPEPCSDVGALLNGWFQVPPWELLSGFTSPIIENPVKWPDGTTEDVDWSGQPLRIDPFAPLSSFVESLLEEPSGIEIVPPRQVVTTLKNLAESFNVAFNPYVPGSYGLDPVNGRVLATVLLALEPVLGRFGPDPDVAVPSPGRAFPVTPVETIVIGPRGANDTSDADDTGNPVSVLSDSRAAAADTGRAGLPAPARKLPSAVRDALAATGVADALPAKPDGPVKRADAPASGAVSDNATAGKKATKSTGSPGRLSSAVKSARDSIRSVVRGSASQGSERSSGGVKGGADRADKAGD